MISPSAFLEALRANDIRFVAGVPDSLLKDVCAAMTEGLASSDHVIAANEGAAVGLALGHYLATGRPALVYLQNSGLGNVVNPIASLADPEIYGAPMVLLVGWRGELLPQGGQAADEPQHKVQGRITPGQLDLLSLPWRVVDSGSDIAGDLAWASREALTLSRPVALLVRKGTFAAHKLAAAPDDDRLPTREAAIAAVLAALPEDAAVVSTTGMASREVFELRKAAGAGHARDFLTVGGMGHAVSIACGIARAQPARSVVCLDGDGALLMHMGALTESARQPNLLHVALNNAAHDSVGGQPTAAARLDLTALAAACGYPRTDRAETVDAVGPAVAALLGGSAAFLEVRCRRGARADLGRPTRTPAENKEDFMRFLARS